jgi:hypothetical protein
VARRHLQRAGTEGHVDVLIGDDGNLAVEHGHKGHATDERGVALVVRMDGHGCIAQNRLRSGRGHRQEAAAGDGVVEVVELAWLSAVLDLQVGHGRLQTGRPVDQVLILIDQPQTVETHKRLAHGGREAFVEGEALAVPVARCAQPAQLAGDVAAVLLLPLPGAAQELVAADLQARRAFVA